MWRSSESHAGVHRSGEPRLDTRSATFACVKVLRPLTAQIVRSAVVSGSTMGTAHPLKDLSTIAVFLGSYDSIAHNQRRTGARVSLLPHDRSVICFEAKRHTIEARHKHLIALNDRRGNHVARNLLLPQVLTVMKIGTEQAVLVATAIPGFRFGSDPAFLLRGHARFYHGLARIRWIGDE